MAMYHFRIKSDKKPSGAKISAAQHLEYINREGKFSTPEQWREKNQFVGNYITTLNCPNGFGGQSVLLYKTDDYGSIKNSGKGIEVTKNATEETIAIALVLAAKTMENQPLILNGTDEFKKAALKVAIQKDLPISFYDLSYQRDFIHNKSGDYPERKNFALHTAKKILEVVEKKKQMRAQSHLQYINREEAYSNRGACIFHAHHLPKWAKDDPKKFFQAADKYEGVGHRRYVEIEFALPNELSTVEQYRQIIDAFIAKHLSEHYYAYAIHDKPGMLSGRRHPHVHIMFSERLIDEVEQKKERAAKAFFLYPARKKKDGSEPSFQEKWKRGAPKARKWCNHQYVNELRADCARIQNEVLERNGYSIRVDHRTLAAQKEEAEENGDAILARLFSREPEKYIGVIPCQDYEEPKLESLKILRGFRERHFDLLMKLDGKTSEAEETELKDDVQFVFKRVKALMEMKEYADHKKVSQEQQELRERMMSALRQVNKWKRLVVSQHEAEEQAKLEYMTKEEQKIWRRYFELLGQEKQLEEFLKTLAKPEEKDKEECEAYDKLVVASNSKKFSILHEAKELEKAVEDIRRRLEQPDYRNNILLVTHKILQGSKNARKKLLKACIDLDKMVDEFRNALFEQTKEEPQTSFKTREVYDLIRRQYSALKEEREKLYVQKFWLQRKIISPQRAMAMAKNIFVNGEFKRLRGQLRKFKKDEQQLTQKLFAYSKEEEKFKSRDWTEYPRSTFLQQQYYLTKQRTLLEVERKRLDQIRFSLQNKQNELDSLCSQADAVKKIDEITVGILRKNYRFVRQLEEMESRDKSLTERMSHVHEQLDALKIRLDRDTYSTRYKVVSPNPPKTTASLAALIADAILFEPEAVQLVARFGDNNLETEKDWELMSEFEKEEFLRKKIVREL